MAMPQTLPALTRTGAVCTGHRHVLHMLMTARRHSCLSRPSDRGLSPMRMATSLTSRTTSQTQRCTGSLRVGVMAHGPHRPSYWPFNCRSDMTTCIYRPMAARVCGVFVGGVEQGVHGAHVSGVETWVSSLPPSVMTPSHEPRLSLVAYGVRRDLYQCQSHTHPLRGKPVPYTGPTREAIQ